MFQVKLSKEILKLELDSSLRVVSQQGGLDSLGDLNGHSLVECQTRSWGEVSPHVLGDRIRFRKSQHQLLGVIDQPYLKKDVKREHLLCRCRGVYLEDIERLLKKQPELSDQEVAALSGAALTCMSCHQDLKQLIQKLKDRDGLMSEQGKKKKSGEHIFPMGIPPSDFCLRCDEALEEFINEQKLDPKIKIEIRDVSAYRVTIKVTGTDDRKQEYLAAEIERYWRAKLVSGIKVALGI